MSVNLRFHFSHGRSFHFGVVFGEEVKLYGSSLMASPEVKHG